MRWLLWLGLMALLAFAAPPAYAQRRLALVVGNAAYQHVPTLANPANDARAVAAALTRLGFETDLVIDADRTAMEAAVRRLGDRAAGVDTAVFFYAGHAVEVGGRNYLIPVSANIRTARDLPFETLDFEAMLSQVEGRARVNLILLDSCRENPFRAVLGATSRSVDTRAGIAAVQSATGTLVAFATAPGQVAQDGTGRHSPFTTALLEHLETPGLEVRQMMGRVRKSVREATGGQQVPWETSALEGDVFLKLAAVTVAPPAVIPPRPAGDTPAIGSLVEGLLRLPAGTAPLPPGKWRLVGIDNRTLRPPANHNISSVTLVQERDNKVTAFLMLRLRQATGSRSEPWPTYGCTQRSVLARRVATMDGDRLDCVRVRLWAPVAMPEGTNLRDIAALFDEARMRPGWLPEAMLSVGVTKADAAGQIAYDLHVDPVAFGFARDVRPADANAWAVGRMDPTKQACVTVLAAWAEKLRDALLQLAAAKEPKPLLAAACRGRV